MLVMSIYSETVRLPASVRGLYHGEGEVAQ